MLLTLVFLVTSLVVDLPVATASTFFIGRKSEA